MVVTGLCGEGNNSVWTGSVSPQLSLTSSHRAGLAQDQTAGPSDASVSLLALCGCCQQSCTGIWGAEMKGAK